MGLKIFDVMGDMKDFPNFYAPKYAEYIWKGHENFIKYIVTLDTGDDAQIIKMTDLAISDIWAVLEDDEKTLDIVARHSNLSISLRPKFMERQSIYCSI